ncbi:MAG: DNA-deoxyinosine glycosylase [Eubacteriales bacterium]|nr:DNA-deoxyinosine glycosylase [Eubacteriales bacterium]MDD3882272.1 DNA-deoxyinosine glycosylase [Eubacteriales bacterium]MDD4512018.1 DNA-deoxyinosine glycosylase [Eubacteriales bacterium]
MLTQPFAPVFDESSRVLVLGSFPSVKSRENGFYYGHPRNRFWAVIAAMHGCKTPSAVDEKLALLHECGIALWDVIESCEITGSSDSSVRSETAADIPALLLKTGITRVYCNGALAHSLYEKHIAPACGIHAVRLPSTSPANAAFDLGRLLSEWRAIL